MPNTLPYIGGFWAKGCTINRPTYLVLIFSFWYNGNDKNQIFDHFTLKILGQGPAILKHCNGRLMNNFISNKNCYDNRGKSEAIAFPPHFSPTKKKKKRKRT